MSIVATISLDGEDLLNFLREHKIKVRYVPDVKSSQNKVLTLDDFSTNTTNSPKWFIDQVDELAQDLNLKIASLEGMGMMQYQVNAFSSLRKSIGELLEVSNLASAESHNLHGENHAS